MQRGKLLEDLAQSQNCFISSLRDPLKRKEVSAALLRAEPEQYSLKEWDYCISYLSGHKIQFMNIKDAREFLKQTGGFSGETGRGE